MHTPHDAARKLEGMTVVGLAGELPPAGFQGKSSLTFLCPTRKAAHSANPASSPPGYSNMLTDAGTSILLLGRSAPSNGLGGHGTREGVEGPTTREGECLQGANREIPHSIDHDGLATGFDLSSGQLLARSIGRAIAVPADEIVLGVRLSPRPRAVSFRFRKGEVTHSVIHCMGQAAPQVCVNGPRPQELARDTQCAACDDVAAIADVRGVKGGVLRGHGGGEQLGPGRVAVPAGNQLPLGLTNHGVTRRSSAGQADHRPCRLAEGHIILPIP